MTSEFDRDLAEIRKSLDASRAELTAVLASLSDGDLEVERRGGWTVRRVLEHVISSEVIYSRVITHLRGRPGTQDPLPTAPGTAKDATEQEWAAREALLTALEGVDEDAFYTIAKVGHEEYSVLSVLENEANHEREHAGQINSILAR
jgi:uncharacterized damage-inducible protein DinB